MLGRGAGSRLDLGELPVPLSPVHLRGGPEHVAARPQLAPLLADPDTLHTEFDRPFRLTRHRQDVAQGGRRDCLARPARDRPREGQRRLGQLDGLDQVPDIASGIESQASDRAMASRSSDAVATRRLSRASDSRASTSFWLLAMTAAARR